MLSVYPSEVQQHYQQTPSTSLYYYPPVRSMPHRQPEVPAGFPSSMTASSPHHVSHQAHTKSHYQHQQQQHQQHHNQQHHSQQHHKQQHHNQQHHNQQHHNHHHHHHQQDAAVTQALEIARESPDGASDPTVSKILDHALSQIWARVQAQPESYVMGRDEFAVFNFFQHRFAGDKTAIAARKRYWDHARA